MTSRAGGPTPLARAARLALRVGVALSFVVWAMVGAAPPTAAMAGPDAPLGVHPQARSSATADPSPTPDDPRAADGGPEVDRSTPRARWAWPLAPRPDVLARFRPPSTAYGPGHRGIDLAASGGQPVRAVAAGRVTFAGVIGGKPTIAVTHADGVRSTYEPVIATVATGDVVIVGQPIGTAAATGSHCAKTCVHLGALRGSTYLDPLLLLGWWRVRLLPLDPPA